LILVRASERRVEELEDLFRDLARRVVRQALAAQAI